MTDPGSLPALYEHWPANALVVLATMAAVACAVLLHYEGLVRLSERLARGRGHRHRKVLYAIGAMLCLHVIEIWIFGVTCWLLLQWPECGSIAGAPQGQVLDAIYLSAVTYSTVGFGDLAPVGALRFLIGTESLLGLMLITWSASFTYLEMEQFWSARGRSRQGKV